MPDQKFRDFQKKQPFFFGRTWTVCICEGVSGMLNFFLCYEDKYNLLHMVKVVCYTVSETKFFFTIIYVAEDNSISVT